MTVGLVRRSLTVILVVTLIVAGCTKAVDVPREQFEATSHAPTGLHTIRTTDGSVYTVLRFSVTDSTLVIQSLDQSDGRYKKVALPIVLLLGDVESMETRDWRDRMFFVLVGLGVVVFIVVGIASFGPLDL